MEIYTRLFTRLTQEMITFQHEANIPGFDGGLSLRTCLFELSPGGTVLIGGPVRGWMAIGRSGMELPERIPPCREWLDDDLNRGASGGDC